MKKIVFFVYIALALLFVGAPAFAGDYNLGTTAGQLGYNKSANLFDTVQLVVKAFLSVLAIVFFGLMLYAGVRWMTAMGKEEDVTKARDTIYAAIIGLVIIGASYGISVFILGALGG